MQKKKNNNKREFFSKRIRRFIVRKGKSSADTAMNAITLFEAFFDCKVTGDERLGIRVG